MLKLYAALLVLLLAATHPSRAELVVCNQSLDVLNVSLGYEETGEFQTEGWWSIGANRCSEIIRQPLQNRYYYLYAEDVFAQPVLAGDVSACVDVAKFFIRGTEECWVRGHRNANFLEVDTQSQERWTVFLKGSE
ncbi:DUF1036 domain-containing protein [Hoeflea ulvae]|uniref:DUF1036 domain-containing protein n=1 Tax=Hoeflea ulvae TaxID=2983764 RepID=A0ABT3YH06_9HYPH|nr:DUF1036 domain-containing protein [Hoeflea ulvae]MCY0095173.1 DUF1036 domain-containing protein [Hoeflea ulvae]